MKNNLSAIMGARLISQTDIANATGLSKPTLSKIYNKRAETVKLQTLIKLCDYLQIPLSELVEYDPKLSADGN